MARVIKIRKGLDINLKGKANEKIHSYKGSDYFSVFPDDFVGFTPKVAVKVGDKVEAGSVIMYDKNHPEVKIVSPVSGEVTEVNRGEKRKLINIVIFAGSEIKHIDYGKKSVAGLTPEQVKADLSNAGLLPFIKQRPYDIVANPQDTPRDIFISAFYTAPLAPDMEFIMRGHEPDFQTGIDALAKLTSGKVYLNISDDAGAKVLKYAKNAEISVFRGPHPAGNVGVQINKLKPINKGETVWVINPTDVMLIGCLYNKGFVEFTRLVALTGSEVKDPGYYQMILGSNVRNIVENNLVEDSNPRVISGNVLTGKKIPMDGYLGAFDNQVTVIPEGNDVDDFFGWATLGANKFSTSRTYLTWLLDPFHKKEYTIDARIKGGKRAMIMSHEYDKVFPMDIYPEHLLKAIIAFNIDKMEELGVYEVAPEDFALCEFVDTSKIEIQQIVRTGLDLLYKEMN